MADSTSNGGTGIAGRAGVVPAIVRTAKPVAFKMQQEIKAAVHLGLIKRLDLEKIALMHENPASQQQLVAAIQQLIGEQNIPLSSVERDRLTQEVLDVGRNKCAARRHSRRRANSVCTRQRSLRASGQSRNAHRRVAWRR